ncbi:PPC domain-containing protein [Treponema sp. TIM-1]|uniref:PPC domain-containing protein n=1 Tax=Treponema sp. TIM-1 TaxID=2898417 RepID=UPI003980CE63
MIFCFFVILPVLYGQTPGRGLEELDHGAKGTALDISNRIPAGPAQKIIIGQWPYRNGVPSLGFYWAAQLTEELTNLPGRSFTLLSGASAADLMISGEIVEVAGVIRVYTRIFRIGDRAMVAGLHADFARTENLVQMLSEDRNGSSVTVPWDSYETDSRETPLPVEIAIGEDRPLINRTIHDRGDVDYFIFLPDQDGVLRMETTGDMDTVMEFFEADSERPLAENDDGGTSENARIQYQVTAGGRYIVRVRGYGDDTGAYGFRAFFTEQRPVSPDEYEMDDDFSSAKTITTGISQQHNFHSGSDVDWVKFEIRQAGRYTIRARGIHTDQLDTYLELYDANQDWIDEDDDGGESLDSLLTVNLQPGTYYLKVECLDNELDETAYIIAVQGDQPN